MAERLQIEGEELLEHEEESEDADGDDGAQDGDEESGGADTGR